MSCSGSMVGTAGRIENYQIGVLLAYHGARGSALFRSRPVWACRVGEDQQRRRTVGVPEEIRFATKPVLARQMVELAFKNGVLARWLSGGSV
jgi:SRSO17 transposase